MSFARVAVVVLSLAVVATMATTGDERKPPALALPTNDPLLKEQWYLFDPQSPHGKPGSINAVGAWKLVRPADPVVIALLDNGVNWTHPDLAANIWVNPGELRKGLPADAGDERDLGGAVAPAVRSLNRKDDDGNGYVDDIVGWDFASGGNNPSPRAWLDDLDHGSMLAGLMAAVPDNKVGIAGVGRNVKVMPLRTRGEFADSRVTIPAAIRYAVRNGARVVATGIEITPSVQARKEFREAMDEAQKKGVLVVLGGSGEMKALAAYPNVLTAGCTAKDGALLPPEGDGAVVKMAAPAVDIRSLSFGGYDRFSHWGFCPSVSILAAAAATLLSQEPRLTPEEVIERMQKTARRHPSMDGKMKVGGLLDMEALLKTVSR